MFTKRITIIFIILCFTNIGGYAMSVSGFFEKYILGMYKNTVSYTQLGSYMEYTIEENTIIIRSAEAYLASGISISDFKIVEQTEDNHKKYFITFYFNQTFDEKAKPNIVYAPWLGIEATINVDTTITDEDKFYYKDKKGEYEIHKATKDSLKNYLTNMFKSRGCSQKVIDEMVADI